MSQADDLAGKFASFLFIVALLVLLVLFSVGVGIFVAMGVGMIVGVYKYVRRAMARRTERSFIRKRPDLTRCMAKRAFFEHYYRILYEVDCEMTGEDDGPVAPGDDVRPRGRLGCLLPFNLFSLFAWVLRFFYVSCARVGFALCFGFSLIGVAIELPFRKWTRKEQHDVS